MGTGSPVHTLGDGEMLSGFPSPGPACQCWGAAGGVQTPSATLVPGCHQLPVQPGKLWAQLRAKFAPVLWPSLTEQGDVPRSKGLPLIPLHARGILPPSLGPAGPLPFLPLIFQPALLLGARLHFQGQLH